MRLLFFSGLLLMVLSKGVAQSHVKFYTKSYSDSVALRWQFFQAEDWKKHIQYGCTIYRKDLKTGTTERLTSYPIKPFDDSTWVFYEYALKDSSRTPDRNIDDNTLLVLSMQHPDKFPFTDETPSTEKPEIDPKDPATRLFLHTLACYASKEASYVGGNYFLDTKVKRGNEYEYLLVKNFKSNDSIWATSRISTKANTPSIKPLITNDFTERTNITISWKRIDTTINYVPSFLVFRSETKDKNFQKLTTKPLYDLFLSDDSTSILYEDKTAEKGKVYYYKVQGTDIFHDLTNFSDPYKASIKNTMEGEPRIDSSKALQKKRILLKWSIDKEDEPLVEKQEIFRSVRYDTLYKKIAGPLASDKRNYLDPNPAFSNYYKILVIGKAGDSAWSVPAYVPIADTLAPAPASILSAICDSLGIVRITYKHAGEADLYKVRLLVANNKRSEFSAIYTVPIKDSILWDTIPLNMKSDLLYYKIQLLDKSYNPSLYSNVIQVTRFDTIPPSRLLFTKITSDSSGIRLQWANSASADVVKTILWRRQNETSDWRQLRILPTDSTNKGSYLDSLVSNGQWYEYTLTAVDKSNLSSPYATSMTARAAKKTTDVTIQNEKLIQNVRKKITKLTWSYSGTGADGFLIYRATNSGNFDVLKKLDLKQREFYDKEITSGNVYRYKIKVVYSNGRNSAFSKELKAQF